MATIRPTGYLAHYGFSEEDVLEHYGVKGMKWGKRKKLKEAVRSARIHWRNADAAAKSQEHYAKEAADERTNSGKWEREIRKAPNTGFEYEGNYVYSTKNAADRQYDAARLQSENEWLNHRKAQRASAARQLRLAEKELDDASFKNTVKRAVEKGKKKISDLLKAADTGWNKSRARDTTIKAANKAGDVVESIRNKDGSISFKKKKK